MPKGHRTSTALREEVVEMARAGIRPPEISKETGLAIPTIYQILSVDGVDVPSKEAAHTPEQIAEAIERHNLGDRAVDIRNDLEMDVNQYYRYLRDAGIDPAARISNIKTERQRLIEVAIEMYTETNEHVWKICEETGISQPVLNQELHRRGVPLRRPRMSSRVKQTVNVEAKTEFGDLVVDTTDGEIRIGIRGNWAVLEKTEAREIARMLLGGSY